MDSQTRIRVVLADDHDLFRAGLRKLLDVEAGFHVIGEARDGTEAVKVSEELRPDLLLLDVAMPGMTGFTPLRELSSRAADVRTILLTAAIDKSQMMMALQLGVRGVVLKTAPPATLVKSMRAVAKGQHWLERGAIGDLVDALRRLSDEAREDGRRSRFGLTRRELQIVAAVAAGETNKGVAERLGVSEDTVKHHLTHIFDKVGVFTRLELALFAINHRLLPDD